MGCHVKPDGWLYPELINNNVNFNFIQNLGKTKQIFVKKFEDNFLDIIKCWSRTYNNFAATPFILPTHLLTKKMS